MTNVGSANETTTVSLTVDGTERDTAAVTLASGESTTVNLTASVATPGEYDLAVDGAQVGPLTVDPVSTVTVTATPAPTATVSPTPSATPTLTPVPSPTEALTATATPAPTTSADGLAPGVALVSLVVALTALALAPRQD